MARRTQQERTEESRRRLIDAAIELIGTKGYAGTTLVEIGLRAGVSRGLVTYHFGSKEACIREVIKEIRSGTPPRSALEVDGIRGLAALDSMSERYLRSYVRGHPAGRAIFVAIVESISSTPELLDVVVENDEGFRSLVRGVLREAIEDGEITHDVDVDLQSILITGLLRGSALQWLVSSSAVDLDAVIPAMQRMVRGNLPVRTSVRGRGRPTRV